MTNSPAPLPDLGPATRAVAALLEGVDDSRFADPTPCEDYRVADLLHHLMGLTLAFRDAARKDLGPLTATDPASPDAPVPSLGPDWRERLRAQLTELAEAWRDPGAWEGETQAGGITLPGAIAGQVALNEVLLHGWDLARATGQPYAADEASAEVSIALLAADADDAAREGTGFGRVVPVPDGASPLDRAVGLSGRHPGWAPPRRADA
ncbi:TIGR03086 family metal-binding protein [Streptomyces radicis]|uniref:TIGR03086 family protein n=1 Tax=Streptomyces radicis TaxID=1750517 RepID=A0A3A9WE70_9ACTN|nr:TIGR03086 family metal-binding protein [Streptomyces radicis]RKN11338.1 TIGR03086 family protein [Streptomyces radicis]RKN26639.1 TIGR03086 family protein [Streptomyces radicis]